MECRQKTVRYRGWWLVVDLAANKSEARAKLAQLKHEYEHLLRGVSRNLACCFMIYESEIKHHTIGCVVPLLLGSVGSVGAVGCDPQSICLLQSFASHDHTYQQEVEMRKACWHW